MSEYYRSNRTRNLYQPDARTPFRLSRSKIGLFLECPRCFYLDRRRGVGRPPGFPFNLNSAVDKLLKKEFDIHRAQDRAHPLMAAYGLDLVPYRHRDLELWRDNFHGIAHAHEASGFAVFGAIDDVWTDRQGSLHIVDYKSTSKDSPVNLDADWQIGYKRQMEVYQWLFRRNGFAVSDTGYFVYANGLSDRAAFDAKLEFDLTIIPYEGKDGWVEDALAAAKKCLDADTVPAAGADCDYCRYVAAVNACK